jgi:hypothetical protein
VALTRLVIALLLGVLASACGGSSSPPGSTPPPTTTTDPCSSAVLTDDQFESLNPTSAEAVALKTHVIDGSPRWRVLDALWTHRENAARADAAREDRRRGLSRGRSNADVGDIAVLQDEGDLILPPNSYDLRSLGLRFTRNGAGGYTITRVAGNFRAALGTRLTLEDDDSASNPVPFSFPFFGRIPTATSRSKSRTSRAPSGTSRDCSPARRGSRHFSLTSIQPPAPGESL